MRLLVIIGLGTFGFGMADVLLEPYGGQALNFSVGRDNETDGDPRGRYTDWASGWPPAILSSGGAPVQGLRQCWSAHRAFRGSCCDHSCPARLLVGAPLFVLGTFTTGVGAGIFGHATLTAAIRSAPRDQIGLTLGAWGSVQATCAGIGVALAGVVRDVLLNLPPIAGLSPHTPYNVVFMVEIIFLALAILIAVPLLLRHNGPRSDRLASTKHDPVEVP